MRAYTPITTCEGKSLRRRLNSQEGTVSQGAWRASRIATGHGGGGCLGLDLAAHKRFDSVKVESLCASVGGLGRIVLDPYRARQHVVLYDLAGDPLDRLGYREAEVSGQLRAEHNGSVLYFIWKVNPHAAL